MPTPYAGGDDADHHDQPPDQITDHAEQGSIDHGRSDQPPTDHLITPAPVPIEVAAAALGITVNAVRQRLKRGTLTGIKADAGWLVDVLPTDQPTTATNQRPTTTDQPTTVDLTPLTELIDRQGRELRQLAEAAAVWQVRALQAEDQLKQLTAGETVEHAAQSTQDGPHDEQSADVDPAGA